jgi:ABC-type glutathione transport system ATPase component
MTELLNIKDVEVTYKGKGLKKDFKALKGVSLDIRAGECVGLVGESGSGKTTLGRAVLGLAPVTAGSITLNGKEIAHATRAERKDIAQDVQVVFQDPYSSLNPAMSIEQILTEPLLVRNVGKRQPASESENCWIRWVYQPMPVTVAHANFRVVSVSASPSPAPSRLTQSSLSVTSRFPPSI